MRPGRLSQLPVAGFHQRQRGGGLYGPPFGRGQDVRALGQTRIAAIGPATAQALKEFGLRAHVVPGAFKAEVLLQALSPLVAPGSRILLARVQDRPGGAAPGAGSAGRRGGQGSPGLPDHGTAGAPPEAAAALKEGAVDVLTFTSSATVHNFAKLLGKERFQKFAAKAVVAAIGPITSATLKGIRHHPPDRAAATPSALAQKLLIIF